MTDTTDIKALREASEIGESSDYMTWPKVDPSKLKRVLDKLEAERQRADSNAQEIRKLEFQWENRAPTQWAYDQACAALHAQRDRAEKAEAEIAELRAKLANPVVLPSRFKPEVSKVDVFKGSPVMKLDATGGWLNRTGVIVALNEAGFTVKGE